MMPKLMRLLQHYFFLFTLLLCLQSNGQDSARLTLEKAYDLANKNYPEIKRIGLIQQTASLNIENLSKEFLPQLSFSGQASYQSDVTKIDGALPNFSFDPLSKDQYRIVAEASQLIYDGGLVKERKTFEQLNATVEQQKVSVDLYQVKDRINQLYLGVLYLDEQLKQADIIRQDLQTAIKKATAQVDNGIAFRSDLNLLKAELLKADQRSIELKASRKGFLDMLALFINQPLGENEVLEKPVIPAFTLSTDVTRPELKLFSVQNQLLGQRNNIIKAGNLPKASLFLQGGYGRPGLNQLKNEFATYYIGGLRLNWSLNGWYTARNERKLVDINKRTVNVRQETFLLNTRTQLKQEESNINKLQQLIATDAGIIDLRRQVKDAAKAQWENGVITANDYLRQVNAEDESRQTMITHQIQLLQAQINYQTIAGKQ